ncbi:RHS repeat-associated core domain-containing protein [Cellulosimicrobium funkei]
MRFSTQDDFAWVDGAWANSTEKITHYDGDGDEPAWIVEDATLPDNLTRYVEGMDGALAVQTGKSGERVLQLVDLHGDVTATLPIAGGAAEASWTEARFTSFDEFGNPQPMTSGEPGNAPPARYGWLGAAQRNADTPTGAILMGVRLYHPATGRFLQTDQVAGGSASAYDYCNADPVNCTDLGGTFTWKGLVKTLAVVGEVASIIPGPVGAAAAGISAVAYAASGNRRQALIMAGTVVAAAVGAGAVVGAIKVARVAPRAVSAAKAGISVVHQSRAVTSVNSKAKAVIGAAKAKLKKNNIIRLGPTVKGGPFRVSLGAQKRHWDKMPRWRQVLQPIHVHMERAKAGVTWNPSGRSERLWGGWKAPK